MPGTVEPRNREKAHECNTIRAHTVTPAYACVCIGHLGYAINYIVFPVYLSFWAKIRSGGFNCSKLHCRQADGSQMISVRMRVYKWSLHGTTVCVCVCPQRVSVPQFFSLRTVLRTGTRIGHAVAGTPALPFPAIHKGHVMLARRHQTHSRERPHVNMVSMLHHPCGDDRSCGIRVAMRD